jgi:hypothetical protein
MLPKTLNHEHDVPDSFNLCLRRAKPETLGVVSTNGGRRHFYDLWRGYFVAGFQTFRHIKFSEACI